MNKIKKLSEELINKIAAGEVAERPSNVLKELIENAIDANASNIKVELENGGKDKITVKDNGEGISKEDLKLALTRHATSKIKKEEDLYSIQTLGFRGEALPSISSISKLSITSKTKDQNYGNIIKVNFGEIKYKEKKTIQDGTKIEVKDLYKNIPARLKFLKTKTTEYNHSLNVFLSYAISFPHISFNLTHNGKEILNFFKNNNLENRLNEIYKVQNLKWIKNYLEYDYVRSHIYILEPKNTVIKNDLKIFVNGRLIKDKIINHAINSFFETTTGSLKTIIVLFIKVNPEFIDVNVSPTKSEVRFREPRFIHSFITSLLESTLKSKNGKNINSFKYKNKSDFIKKETFVKKEIDISKNIESLNLLYKDLNLDISNNIIGQFNKQFIILEEDETLVLIDQHAAHERINYEKILNSLNNNIEIQNLLIPEEIRTNDTKTFDKLISKLKVLGFNIQKQDSNYLVLSIPKALEKIDLKNIFKELINENPLNLDLSTIKKLISEIAARVSCHASIRGKQNLRKEQIYELLKTLENCNYPYSCPHGRPIKISITKDKIEKMFQRKK
jgi:DNA mismatch repair protein MutL